MSSTLSKLALSVSCQSYCVNIACCELHRDGLVFSKHITQVIVAREYVGMSGDVSLRGDYRKFKSRVCVWPPELRRPALPSCCACTVWLSRLTCIAGSSGHPTRCGNPSV